MNKMMTCLLLAAACLVAGPLLAQSTTQGAIDGTIFDSTDAVVSKAAVTIHSNATNAEIHLAADESGYFKAPLLEPGTYTVTIVAAGFRDYRANNVIVQVSQITTLIPHLATGAASQVVEVTASRPVLNFDSPDFSSNLNLTALNNIPINNRRWSALAMTTPGVVRTPAASASSASAASAPCSTTSKSTAPTTTRPSSPRSAAAPARPTPPPAAQSASSPSTPASTPPNMAAPPAASSPPSPRAAPTSFHGQAYFYDRESNWNAFNDYARSPRCQILSTGKPTATPQRTSSPRTCARSTASPPAGAHQGQALLDLHLRSAHARLPGHAIPDTRQQLLHLADQALAHRSNLQSDDRLRSRVRHHQPQLHARRRDLHPGSTPGHAATTPRRNQLRSTASLSSRTDRPRQRAALRLPGDQHPQARLAGQPARITSASSTIVCAGIRPAACRPGHQYLLGRHLGQRLRQARLRRGQAHQPHHVAHQQRSALPVRPRARLRDASSRSAPTPRPTSSAPAAVTYPDSRRQYLSRLQPRFALLLLPHRAIPTSASGRSATSSIGTRETTASSSASTRCTTTT